MQQKDRLRSFTRAVGALRGSIKASSYQHMPDEHEEAMKLKKKVISSSSSIIFRPQASRHRSSLASHLPRTNSSVSTSSEEEAFSVLPTAPLRPTINANKSRRAVVTGSGPGGKLTRRSSLSHVPLPSQSLSASFSPKSSTPKKNEFCITYSNNSSYEFDSPRNHAYFYGGKFLTKSSSQRSLTSSVPIASSHAKQRSSLTKTTLDKAGWKDFITDHEERTVTTHTTGAESFELFGHCSNSHSLSATSQDLPPTKPTRHRSSDSFY